MAVVDDSPRLDEVWLVSLDPTQGSEIQKTRPCLVISPDEMNRHLRTVIIAPMTTTERQYPTRVTLTFHGKHGQVALDQIRAVDRQRLVRKMGKTSLRTGQAVSAVLVEMFARQRLADANL
jgi:mRNA interferase MazF